MRAALVVGVVTVIVRVGVRGGERQLLPPRSLIPCILPTYSRITERLGSCERWRDSAEVRTADISMLHPLGRLYPPRAGCAMRLQPPHAPHKRPFRLRPTPSPLSAPRGVHRCVTCRTYKPSAVSINTQLIHPCLFRRAHLVVRTSASACSACVRPRSRPASCIPPICAHRFEAEVEAAHRNDPDPRLRRRYPSHPHQSPSLHSPPLHSPPASVGRSQALPTAWSADQSTGDCRSLHLHIHCHPSRPSRPPPVWRHATNDQPQSSPPIPATSATATSAATSTPIPGPAARTTRRAGRRSHGPRACETCSRTGGGKARATTPRWGAGNAHPNTPSVT
jgi:hypothetical protein